VSALRTTLFALEQNKAECICLSTNCPIGINKGALALRFNQSTTVTRSHKTKTPNEHEKRQRERRTKSTRAFVVEILGGSTGQRSKAQKTIIQILDFLSLLQRLIVPVPWAQ
jgi:hypothetical protein